MIHTLQPRPKNEGPYYSIRDAAAWAETSPEHVSQMIASGRLKAIQVRSLIRISEWEVARRFGLELPGPRTLEIEEQEHSQPRPVAEAIAYVHHWVYFLHDEADELLYVGITCTGTGRMLQHAREKGWWPQVDHIQIEHFESRDEALAREAEVIAERRPPFNRALPRGVKA